MNAEKRRTTRIRQECNEETVLRKGKTKYGGKNNGRNV